MLATLTAPLMFLIKSVTYLNLNVPYQNLTIYTKSYFNGMSSTEVYQLNLGPITAHAFNKDRTQVAVCPNNNEVQIYAKAGKGWNLTHTLVEHDKLVTSIDWAPESNRLVTSSQDRNTYVWNLENGEWKPTLVLLRINRAATFVRWSPHENKFAVASGARVIAVCYFDEEHNWWTSKHLKKPMRSTVSCLDWHPNNSLLAAGSADFKAYVISAFVKGVDERPSPTAWGEKYPFNAVCGEFSNGSGGWIHSVAFSPSGEVLAFAGHDSEISIAYPGGAVQNIRLTGLPYLSLIWASEEKIIAVGYDCAPVLFEKTNEEWKLSRIIDAGKKKVMGESTAFNRFREWDTKGRSGNEDSELNTIHQNTITSIRPFLGIRDNATHFSTSGLDGKLVIWDLESLENKLGKLNI